MPHLIAAITGLLVVVALVGCGDDEERAPDDPAVSRATSSVEPGHVTTLTKAQRAAATAKPTLQDARDAVDAGDYNAAVNIVSGEFSRAERQSISRRVSNHVARRILDALRAGDRDQAQKALWHVEDYPMTPKLRQARRAFRIAEQQPPRPKRTFKVSEAVVIEVHPRNGAVVSCPVAVRFVGRITVVGGAGTVSYRWVTSDGLTPIKTLRFAGPGSLTVATTERFSGAPRAGFNKEQLIQITDIQPPPPEPFNRVELAESRFECG